MITHRQGLSPTRRWSSARTAGWALLALFLACLPSAAADVDALQAEALAVVNDQIACQWTSPDERSTPCARCADAALFPFDLHLPEILACEVDHWMGKINSPDAVPACARVALVERLRQLSSPPPLAELKSSYLPQLLSIETPNQLNEATGFPFARWVLFNGAADEVELGRESDTPPPPAGLCVVTDDAAVELIVDAAVSVNRYVAQANEGLLKRGAAGLARLRDDWVWFLESGLGQFPWERAFNALTDRRGGIEVLPDRQWVLFHPSVAAELGEGDFALDELRAHEALLVEPFGFVRYRFSGPVERPERSFWGGSLLVSMREDEDPGVGLLARRGTIGLGAIWRQVDDDDGGTSDEISLVFTLDLLGRIQQGQETYESYRDSLTNLIE